VYNLGLNEFFEWYGQEPRPGFTKATVSAWRVALEARGLGAVSINVRITAVRKLAAEAADNGLLSQRTERTTNAARHSSRVAGDGAPRPVEACAAIFRNIGHSFPAANLFADACARRRKPEGLVRTCSPGTSARRASKVDALRAGPFFGRISA
jgi:hypothetical protein